MRRIAIVLGIGALLISVAAAAAIFWRIEIAGALLRVALARAGFPEARFAVERVSAREIVVGTIEDGEALRIERVEVALDLTRLPSFPVERVRMIGASLEMRAPAARPGEPPKEAPAPSIPLDVLPVLELERAILTIPSAAGPVTVRLASRVAPEPGGAITMHLEGSVEGRAAEAAIRVDARRDATGRIDVAAEASKLRARLPQLDVRDGSAKLRLEVASAGLLVQSATGTIEISLTGVVAGGSDLGAITITAPVDLDSTGEQPILRISNGRLSLRDHGFEAAAVSGEASAGGLDLRVGRIGGTGKQRLGGGISAHVVLRPDPSGVWSPSGSVELADATIETERVRMEGISGSVSLGRLRPPETTGPQSFRIREIRSGVSLADSVFRWELVSAAGGRGSGLRIERFETGFAGGRIFVENAFLDPAAEENRLEFRLEGIEAEKLFTIASLQGVSGTGRLAGAIPVAVRKGAVAIPESRLSAENGILRIRSEAVGRALAGGGESAALLLDALRDFHYDDLVIEVKKAFDGEATVQLRLEGRNPAVLEGRAFRINVNLTGNVDRLVASLLEIARLSDRAVRATVSAVPGGDR